MENLKNKYNDVGTKAYVSLKTISPRVKCFEKKARNHIVGDKKAQGILEYAIILAVVSIGVIGGIMVLKNSIMNKLSGAAADIASKN